MSTNPFEPHPEAPLDEQDVEGSQLGAHRLSDEAVGSRLDVVLDLEQILSAAHLPEDSVRICMDGKLQARHDAVEAELMTMVDSEGKVLADDDAGEPSLADTARAQELNSELIALKRDMRSKTFTFTFRAMPTDEWEAWEKAHRDSQGRPKNQRAYENELISQCAVSPPLSVEDVDKKLRPKLNFGRFVRLFNAAYNVNRVEGLDLEK